jgi:hypothetical protein
MTKPLQDTAASNNPTKCDRCGGPGALQNGRFIGDLCYRCARSFDEWCKYFGGYHDTMPHAARVQVEVAQLTQQVEELKESLEAAVADVEFMREKCACLVEEAAKGHPGAGALRRVAGAIRGLQ